MLEIVFAGGWLMVPILACSIIAAAIIIERFVNLRRKRVLPAGILERVRQWAAQRELDRQHIEQLQRSSPLGRVLAAALVNRRREREVIKDSVEDTGRHVVHELERFLNTLGTIAGITPLLGLLGTVIGMIEVFSAIMIHGVGDPNQLAGGISQALITTAAGLTVAIPSYFFYRYFRGLVRAYVVEMEQQSMELLHTIERKRPQAAV
ncbi:MotA/TolQ/ExbB proton channel family protein [Wenzhouxiangella sp. EGI_FJ10409]|uniref:MotA/TolQ/ExbB proton channel family protein n=1 Tax=Wenzhouxiangella sp. EGI_FJ10409 TaxID=3243767 RepID=UPI0035D79182